MAKPTSDPLPELNSVLKSVKALYGDYTIAPPETMNDPTAIVLPQTIGACSECEQFKPKEELIGGYCAECILGIAKRKKDKRSPAPKRAKRKKN